MTPDREAVLKIMVIGPDGTQSMVEAIIDTGFTEEMTLPPAVVSMLKLPFRTAALMKLADGSDVMMDAYDADVVWHGSPRRIIVYAAEGSSLIGISLLYGSRLTLDAIDGGNV